MPGSNITNQDVYARMDIVDRAMSTWREAEKTWLKAYNQSKAGHLDAIYPALLKKISLGMTAGIKDINAAFRDLAKDYAGYSSNSKFVRQYKDRIAMIEMFQEELNAYQKNLQGCMTLIHQEDGRSRLNPAYREGIRQGRTHVVELTASLEQTKVIMQQELPSFRPRP